MNNPYFIKLKCQECNSTFFAKPDEGWKTLCMRCWKKSKSIDKDREIATLRSEVCYWKEIAQRRGVTPQGRGHTNGSTPLIIQDNLRFMIMACHPDRNPQSFMKEATEVTKWLLSLRIK